MQLCGSNSKPAVRKIVILGDGTCGKTSLLDRFTRGYFRQVYEPTVFENYVHDVYIDRRAVQLSLWDTAGQEEYDRLRTLSYADTHCIMLCFAVDSPDSLENAQTKWITEINDNCPGVKLVLVALKCDLRSEEAEADPIVPNKRLVAYDEGVAVAKKIGALRYLECSAKKDVGVREAFTEAARLALSARNRSEEESKTSCTIQ